MFDRTSRITNHHDMANVNALKLIQSSSWEAVCDNARATLVAAIALADSKGVIKCSHAFLERAAGVDHGAGWVKHLIEKVILQEEDGNLVIVEWDDFGITGAAERQARHRAKVKAQQEGGN